MKKYFIDKQYKFSEVFDTDTGFYARTGIIDNGKDTNKDPFMRSYPLLLDIGIMGHCKNATNCHIGCYQGKLNKPNMIFDDFKKIIDESIGKTFEVALGGNGSPNEHEDFIDILKYARNNDIVPNYTTSGIELTDEQIQATKDYCGAVAVSEYHMDYTYKSINRFIEAGVKTNIHYVLGNDSIDEAIYRLENNVFPKGINAVIFLLYKPVGCIKENNVLKYNDERIHKFYKVCDTSTFDFKIGFDACNVPGLVNFSENINFDFVTPCDGARFSGYISSDMFMMPCSFDTLNRKWAISIKEKSIEDIWNCDIFNNFRQYHRYSCKQCKDRLLCYGGCPLTNDIILCNRKERNTYKF
jgi:radical SAM protein with 4Fe4S-binding SPASM domain